MRTFAITVLTVCLGGWGCRTAPEPTEKEEPRAVRVRSPRVFERQERIRASGSVEARSITKLGFEVAGRVAAMRVEEGQIVTAGQLLAELSDRDYRIDEAAAAGDLQAARAQADKAAAGVRRQELEQARVALEQADDEYKRLKALYERKSLAPVDFQKIEARWKAAREQYDLAREGAREEDRRASEALAAKASAGLEYRKKRVSDTRLHAPFGGVIARRLVDPGDMVAAGTPVVVLLALDPARVAVGIPEGEIGRLRAGQNALIRIPSLIDSSFHGRVEIVGFAADPASRTFPVKILTPNPSYALRAGMVAEAEIETDRREEVLTVPGEAVIRDPQGATVVFVYFPDKRRVFARRIQVGRPVEREVEIVSGLTRDDRIVVAGQHLVREGSLVRTEEEAK